MAKLGPQKLASVGLVQHALLEMQLNCVSSYAGYTSQFALLEPG